jgi:tetratricopeptide (TPR) repeat protein
MSLKTKWWHWIVPPSFFVICLLIYSNSFEVPFYLDDFRNISENISLRLKSLTISGIAEALTENPIKTRAIAYLSFALNFYFHQYNTFGYHIINTLIHALCGILLFYFIKLTLMTPCLRYKYNNPIGLAFIAALLWMVHPIQTQAVTYIVQRMTSMSSMFFVLSMLCYIRARFSVNHFKRNILFLCCFIAWTLALGSKEIAITLPFFLFLYEWYFFQDLDFLWLRRRIPYILLIFLIISFIAVLYLGSNPLQTLFSGYARRNFTMPERLLTEFRVFFFYLGLLILPYPSRLSLEHHFSISKSLVDPASTGISILAFIVILLVAVFIAKKKRLLSFCILWFVGNLILESSIIPLEIIFEHRLYLPSMLFFLFITAITFEHFQNNRLVIGFALSLIVFLCFLTYQRNHIWKDPVLFWGSSVQTAPASPRAHNNLGAALTNIGRHNEALQEVNKAIALMPDFVNAYVNLGNIYLNKKNFALAIESYKTSLKLKPDYFDVYMNLGNAYFGKGATNEAIAAYSKVLDSNPLKVEARMNRGAIYAQQGFYYKAVEDFQKAVELSPKKSDIYYNLGLAYSKIGLPEKALEAFEMAYKLNPSDKSAKQQIDILKTKALPPATRR